MLSALYPVRTPRPRAAAVPIPNAAPAPDVRETWIAAVVLLAISHQLALAFLHTHLGLGGKSIVILTEVALVAACLPRLLRRMPLGMYLAITLLFVNAVVLALLRQSIDPKALRDLLVPLIFLGVGMAVGREAAADRILRGAIWLVLAFALFEYFALDTFMRLFDIQTFYLARGVGDPDIGLYRDDKLVASALRPEGIGRNILPFLGPHRVSSVFVEPVSMGNFAVICAAWGLAKPREDWRNGAFFVVAALALLVLSDSRFGLLTTSVLVVLRLLLVRGAEPIGLLFPPLCAAALIAIAIATGGEYSDSLIGRLTLTGRTLLSMPGRELFGIGEPTQGYHDMGYPYILANFGLVACLLLWGVFWLLPRESATACRFHVYVALYLALILCVSGNSAFAFKTSAVLWFLLGTLTVPRVAGKRRRR